MTTTIYYFSATGNSLSVARKIAIAVDNTKLVPITSAKEVCTNPEESIGFVFPVYAYGLPRIVEEFIKTINIPQDKYVFAVVTCAGTPGSTLKQLNRLLQQKDRELDAGFVVKEQKHTFLSGNAFMRFMIDIAGEQPRPTQDRITEIIRAINKKKNHKLETSSPLANFIGGLLHKIAIKSFKDADRNFWVNEGCNSCKTCQKICPRSNIKILDNKLLDNKLLDNKLLDNGPVWHHDCELCFACVQWCPNRVIEYKDTSVGQKRTHHKDIEIKDMISN